MSKLFSWAGACECIWMNRALPPAVFSSYQNSEGDEPLPHFTNPHSQLEMAFPVLRGTINWQISGIIFDQNAIFISIINLREFINQLLIWVRLLCTRIFAINWPRMVISSGHGLAGWIETQIFWTILPKDNSKN